MTLSRRSLEPSLRYCKGRRRDGEPCNQTVGKGDDYCGFHNPKLGARKMSQLGEQAQKKVWSSDSPNPNFTTKHTRRKFYERVSGQVLQGKLAEKLANVALRACEAAAAEDPPPLRALPLGPAITINVVVLGTDGSRSMVSLSDPASEPAFVPSVSLPPPQPTEDDA